MALKNDYISDVQRYYFKTLSFDAAMEINLLHARIRLETTICLRVAAFRAQFSGETRVLPLACHTSHNSNFHTNIQNMQSI